MQRAVRIEDGGHKASMRGEKLPPDSIGHAGCLFCDVGCDVAPLIVHCVLVGLLKTDDDVGPAGRSRPKKAEGQKRLR